MVHPQISKHKITSETIMKTEWRALLELLFHTHCDTFWDLFHLISISDSDLLSSAFLEPRMITQWANMSFFKDLTLTDQTSTGLVKSIVYSLMTTPTSLNHIASIVLNFPLTFVYEILEHMLEILCENTSNLWIFLLFSEKITPTTQRDAIAFRNSFLFPLVFAYYDKADKCVAVKIFFEKFFNKSLVELSKANQVTMFCWKFIQSGELQDLEHIQGDMLSNLDDVLAHLMLLFSYDGTILLNHLTQMFLTIGINATIDTPSFREVLSSLSSSILFKLFNLFLVFTHMDQDKKVFLASYFSFWHQLGSWRDITQNFKSHVS